MEIIATTFAGLEEVLAEEIRELGGERITFHNRAISFDGNKRLLYKANLSLRTAVRLLTPIKKAHVNSEKALYNFVRHDVDWTKFMDTWDKFIIDPVVWSEDFTHSQYVAQKAKDAIVDQFREATKSRRRPTVSGERPTLRINIRIIDRDAVVSLDSSDDPLFKRGYRVQDHDAPVNETTAAALLKLSGWDRKSPLLDPMSGSGTIAIEAAMYATNRAPGLCRKEFGFMRWKNFSQELYDEVVAELKAEITDTCPEIYAFDLSPVNSRKAQENAKAAGVDKYIHFGVKNFFKLENPAFSPGMVLCNPPYDERLKIKDIGKFYYGMGGRLREEFPGWKAWFLSSRVEEMDQFGQKIWEYRLKNGGLECVFREVNPEVVPELKRAVEPTESEPEENQDENPNVAPEESMELTGDENPESPREEKQEEA